MFQELFNLIAGLRIGIALHVQPDNIGIASEPRHLTLGKFLDGMRQLSEHIVPIRDFANQILRDIAVFKPQPKQETAAGETLFLKFPSIDDPAIRHMKLVFQMFPGKSVVKMVLRT